MFSVVWMACLMMHRYFLELCHFALCFVPDSNCGAACGQHHLV